MVICLLLYMLQVNKMANWALKRIFQAMHSDIVDNVNPNLIMDALLLKEVISSEDHYEVSKVAIRRVRCKKLLSHLDQSLHPQAFIYLRLALLDKYSWIVDNIDEQLLHKLYLGKSTDGKLL